MTDAEVIAQLQGLQASIPDACKRAENTCAQNISLTAISLAPEETTQLANSIDVVNNSNVVVEAPFAAYVEFGTGNFAAEYVATLPQEWQDEARQFFVNGLGKGSPHPFFYPAVLRHAPELPNEIEKEIAKLVPQ